MENKKSKNIVVVSNIFQGHFTGLVEIVRELTSLGHHVTCYVLDEFKERIKDVASKVVDYKIDRNEIKKLIPPGSPPFADNSYVYAKSCDCIISLLSKDETKYDYYLFDSFYDIVEMNKILKIPLEKYILVCVSHIFSDEDYLDTKKFRMFGIKSLNEKYNLNCHDLVEIHYIPNKFKKLILTSKLFHYKSENCDETSYFLGPKIEKRPFDGNFKFTIDKNKKLIYVSCGTIYNVDISFYKACIEALKDSDEYQLIITVGQYTDLKVFKDIPKNVSIFNFVPQSQIFSDVYIFITHGGLNSTHESILCGVPLIVVPQKYDQFDTARRVEQLEAGIFIDKKKTEITANVIKDAINTISSNREKYLKGVDNIKKSLLEATNNRKKIYEEIFV